MCLTQVKRVIGAVKILHQQSTEVMKHQENKLQRKLRPVKIYLCADRQGRKVKDIVENNSSQHISATIKPSAKFKDVMEGSSSADATEMAVFLAGSNDVARNEEKDLLLSSRKKL